MVSYNSSRQLASCLSALMTQRGVSLEITVVDNASTDGSADLTHRDFPHVRLIRNRENRGFARANNQVLEATEADFYALVNPDAIVPPGAVAACLDHLEKNPEAGVVGTRLVFPGGALQPSCHAFLNLRNLLGETLGAHRLFPGLRPFTSLHMPWFRHDRIAVVDWIQGAFLVVRGAVVRDVGGLDPAFFMYGEEMDWCRRIRRAGWTTVFLPEPPVVHAGGASSGPIAGPMFVENLKGRVRFLRKHRGRLAAAGARALIGVSVLLRAARNELQALGLRLAGRSAAESGRRRQEMFRSALRWVARGLPV